MMEAHDASVFQQTIDHTDNLDVFAKPFFAWNKATDPANIQADLDSSARSLVQSINDFFVDQRVNLCRDLRVLIPLSTFGFKLNHFQQRFSKVDWSRCEFSK